MVVKSLVEGLLLLRSTMATQTISFDLASLLSWRQKCHKAMLAQGPTTGFTPVNCEGLKDHHFWEDPKVAYMAVGLASTMVAEAASLCTPYTLH